MRDVSVHYEKTPNPESLKFVVGTQIAEENVNFASPSEAGRSPLAAKLFGFPWAEAIYLGTDFVTITKQDWVDWDVIAEPLCDLIKEHIDRNEPVLLEAIEPKLSDISDDDSDDVKKIKTIINTEIRPAVNMDGGDIAFLKYEDQVVYIHMQGACSGCPSSTITLKQGIEVRLKNAMPEIKEVVSV